MNRRGRVAARIAVRAATESDLPEVLAILRKMLAKIPYYNELAKRSEYSKHTTRYLRDKIRQDKYAVLVARDESGIIGFALSRFDDYLLWLEWIVVSPTSRQRGVGSALLTKLLETAPIRRAHKVWCDTRTTNEPAKSMFRKNGFTEIAEVRNHWYGEDYILWERQVTGNAR